MNCVVLQKVIYRLPKSNRPVFAVVLGRSSENGLALLLLKANGVPCHTIAIAVEEPDGTFVAAQGSEFSVELDSITPIAAKLRAVAGSLAEEQAEKFLEDLL